MAVSDARQGSPLVGKPETGSAEVDAHADLDERRDRGEPGSISRKDVSQHGAEHVGDAHRPHQGVESMDRTRDAADDQVAVLPGRPQGSAEDTERHGLQ
eukprot:14716002-Heterocapsa_arctica.AAC.1